jgi:hypothetical protein
VELKSLEEMALKISAPCANYANQCPPVYLTLTVTESFTRCTGRPQSKADETSYHRVRTHLQFNITIIIKEVTASVV